MPATNLLLLGVGGATAAAGADSLLMETSDYLLLETGDRILTE